MEVYLHIKISQNEIDYIIWQNRALDFYIAARLCIRNELYLSAAFSAQQSIETLLKATLLYWDKSFSPERSGYAIKKQVKMLRNKVRQGADFSVPEYFYHEQRYQSVSRYPKQGKGIGIAASACCAVQPALRKPTQISARSFSVSVHFEAFFPQH